MSVFGKTDEDSPSIGAVRVGLQEALVEFLADRDVSVSVLTSGTGRTEKGGVRVFFQSAQAIPYGWQATFALELGLGQSISDALDGFDKYVDYLAEFAFQYLDNTVITVEKRTQGGSSPNTGGERAVLVVTGTRNINR